MPSDYYSIDELDTEAREDLEIALYGMLHHASNEGDKSVIPPNNKENSSLIQTTVLDDTSNIAKVKSLHSSENQNGKQLKATNFVSTSPTSLSSVAGLWQPSQHSDCMKQIILTNKNKTQVSPRNSKPKEQLDLKRNPYSQRLIIEESSKPSWLKKKPLEVITLSDEEEEEDSKYASINKSSIQNMGKKILSFPAGAAKALPDTLITLPSASSIDGSESDSSVTVLDALPGPSCMYVDSSTDSSDSEIEVTQPPKIGYDKVNIKLNIKQPGLESSHVTCSNPSSSSLNWEKYSSEKWTPDMIKFYDRDGCDRDLEATLKSLPKNVRWHLDIEDRRGSDLQRNRYFGRSAKMRCANCSQWDHLAKDCRESRKVISCGICGLLGHKQFACPNKMCLGVSDTIF